MAAGTDAWYTAVHDGGMVSARVQERKATRAIRTVDTPVKAYSAWGSGAKGVGVIPSGIAGC